MNVLEDNISATTTVDQTGNNVHNTVPIELTNTTGMYLDDLNDDCLREIFSSAELTTWDLCSLAETCTKFKSITQHVYQNSKFGISYGFNGYRFAWKNKVASYQELQDVEKILKHFGPQLKTLLLEHNEHLVKFIAKYCGDVPFKRLKIHRLKSIGGIQGTRRLSCIGVQLKSIFQRLLVLSIDRCDLSAEMLSSNISCDSLIELKIVNSIGCNVLLTSTFPKLRKFSFVSSRYIREVISHGDDLSDTDALLNFIECHKLLTTLVLRGQSLLCGRKLIETIDNNCKELQELTLRDLLCNKTSFDISNLQITPKWRILEVDFRLGDCEHQLALLQASKSLDTLKFYFVHETPYPERFFCALLGMQSLCDVFLHSCSVQYVITLTKLTGLRKVTLWYPHGRFCAADLFNIITKLTRLEEFAFIHHWGVPQEEKFVLSEEDFSEIVKLTEHRMHELKLICSFDFNLFGNFNEKRNVRLIKPGKSH